MSSVANHAALPSESPFGFMQTNDANPIGTLMISIGSCGFRSNGYLNRNGGATQIRMTIQTILTDFILYKRNGKYDSVFLSHAE